jgi:fatty-acyl-CoA synthase
MTPSGQPPTIGSLVLRALRRHPSRTAFAWDGGSWTYAATDDLVGRMQVVLARHGVQPGCCVAILAANKAAAWCAATAAHLLGATTTQLHPRGSLADHLAHLQDSDADVLVLDPQGFAARSAELAAAGGRTVLTLAPADLGTDLLAAAQAVGSTTAVDQASAESVYALSFTGGTTGKSKAAVRLHRDAVSSCMAILADFELPARPHYLAVAPISHVAGTKIVPTLLRGGTVRLLSGFDPGQMLAVLERERINCTLLVPTMIYTLLDCPALGRTDLSALELMLYGASPMSPTRLVEGLERIGPVFAQLYGQTECYPIAVLPRADHDPQRPDLLAACGFPCSNVDLALLDEAGQPVAPGQAGEICVRSPTVMQGYRNAPTLTAEALAGGWLHTGDVATQDGEGRLSIVDRKKDMIVTGGFNVYTREVEDVISAQPGVAMVAVFGVPDPKWGEAVTAYVVRQPGADVSAEALVQQVKTRKGAAHAPKHVSFVDTLPLTSVGKIDKKALRQRFWEGQARQVG